MGSLLWPYVLKANNLFTSFSVTGMMAIRMAVTFILFVVLVGGFLIYVKRSASEPDVEESDVEKPDSPQKSVTTPLLKSHQGLLRSSVKTRRASISMPRQISSPNQDIIKSFSYSFSPAHNNHLKTLSVNISQSTEPTPPQPINYKLTPNDKISKSKSAPNTVALEDSDESE